MLARGLLALVVVCACGGGGGRGDRDDAGEGAGRDAAVLDAATAPDASSRDADLPGGPVVVRVERAGSGVNVVLHRADGAVLAEAVTDENGQASFADPPPGALVSALVQSGGGPEFQVFTVVGVEGGDTIVVGDPLPSLAPTSDVGIDYPGALEGADTYLADLGCDAYGQVDPDAIITRAVPDTCLGVDGDYDVLAMARLDSTPLAFSTVRNVAPVGGGEQTDIALPAWVAASSRQLTIDQLTAEVTDSTIDLRPVLDGTTRSPLPGDWDGFVAPAPGQVDGWLARATVSAFAGEEGRIWARRLVLPAATSSPYALHFPDFGPRFEAISFDTADPARPQLVWTTSTSTGALGAVAVVVSWSDLATDPISGHRWTIVLPPGSETVTMPALPDDGAAFRPSATADFTLVQLFGLWHARQDDYRAFRNDRPFALGAGLVDDRVDDARMVYYQTPPD